MKGRNVGLKAGELAVRRFFTWFLFSSLFFGAMAAFFRKMDLGHAIAVVLVGSFTIAIVVVLAGFILDPPTRDDDSG